MHPALRFAQTAYVEAHHLLPLLKDYANPRDLLARMVKSGDLIRLKNGFFVITDKIKHAPVPFEQIANLLYGPSYLSLEWALSFYGMIPEGVYVVTSVTTQKLKSYQTPLATFDYYPLRRLSYIIGADQKENAAGRFLIATPEKALADLLHFKSKNLDGQELLDDLIEGRRIEKSSLKQLDKKHLKEIAKNTRSRAVTQLIHTLGLL